MSKKISLTGVQAREAFVRGAKYLSSTIGQTLGPFGSNAYLEHGHKLTNDGFSISAELANTLEDEFERQGALTLHETSSKVNDQVGDCTTSVQILAQSIIDEAIRLLPNEKSITAKHKPSEVLKMIEDSKINVISKLKEGIKLVESEQELIQSAKVSVEDGHLAQLIGSTQWKIGKDGIIIVEEVLDPVSSVDIVKGIRIDNGFGTPYIVTNEAEQSLEVNDVSVLLTNYTIGDKEILDLKTKVIDPLLAEKKLALVIIGRAFTSQAIQMCMESAKAGFAIFPINAPYTYQSEIMKDLAAITGATYYDTEDSRLEDLQITDIGFATKILARRFDAIITGKEEGNLERITKRVRQLQERLAGQVSDFERKAIQTRIAQFTGGFAILKIGAETVFERKYKKDKADDAVNSVRLALQEGTVKGGGLAFKEISESLDEADILKRPLMCIYNQIMSSAPEGYEIPGWCRDPYLTLVSALKNACSVAGAFSTVNAVITTKDKKECSHANE